MLIISPAIGLNKITILYSYSTLSSICGFAQNAAIISQMIKIAQVDIYYG
jgi:hypothetical protein